MHPLMQLGLANAACAAILAVVALAVGRWVRRPALTHVLWLLVLVKLVTPPLFPLPLAWLPAEEVKTPEAMANSGAATYPIEAVLAGPPGPDDVWMEMEKDRVADQAVLKRFAERAVTEEQPEPRMIPAVAPPALAASTITRTEEPSHASATAAVFLLLAGVWLAGAVLWFTRAAVRLERFRRLLRHAQPVPDHVRSLAERLARKLGLRRCPEISLLTAPLPPMVWGALGRVRVLLPARLLGRLDEQQLAALLTHELAHVRRGDHWVRQLEFVVLGLFWWYPLAWWARTRLQAAEEECCDAWVVDELPARAYASAIVETVDFLADDLAAIPALASGLGRTDALKRRLTLILSGTAPKRLNIAGRLAILGLALGLLPLLPTLAHSEKKPADGQDASTPVPGNPADEALALRSNALNFIGSENQVAAIGLSRDGKYLAVGCGTVDRTGEVRVWSVSDRKEVLSYATAQGVAAVAFAPDGTRIASAGYDSQAVIREFPSGKVIAVLPLDGYARLVFTPDGKRLVTVTEARTIKVWEPYTGAELARITSDKERCYCVGCSPDGKLLAVGGGDLGDNNVPNQITIYDTETLKPVGTLPGHGGPVLCVSFAADGKTIATGSTDGIARLWQTDGFKLLGALEGHEDWVKAIAFTPDGKTLVTGSHDGSARLWDVAKRLPITRLDGHVAPVRSVAVSPDGKTIFSGGARRMLKVWDAATHKELPGYPLTSERSGEDSIILTMAHSPDGRLLATAHEDGTISIRNAANGDLRRTLVGHADAATCLVFSRDGKTLFSGSADQTVRLWDVETGKQKAKLSGHTSWVYALALAPDGKTLASGAYDKTVRLWDVAALREIGKLDGHKGAVRSLMFSPDGKVLASGAGDHTIKLWDLAGRKEQATLTGHEGTVRALAYSPAGTTIASGSEDGTVRIWDAAGKERAVLKGHNNKVTAIAFSPLGRYVVSAGMDATLRLWDVSEGRVLQTLRGHDDALSALSWTPDGRFVVTAGYDRTVKLWVVTTGVLHTLAGHTGPVQMASFSPDGKYVLSCSAWPMGDKTMRLWDAQSGKEVRKFEGHTGPVGCAVFSPDGRRALSGSFDKTVRLWDVETGKQLRVLEGHTEEVPRVVFSPDGTKAASCSHDRTVRIWDLESGKSLRLMNGHGSDVRGLAWTPDGKRIVSADIDGSVRVWDANTGNEVNLVPLPKARINFLAVSPDAKRVAVAHGNAIRILDLETGKQLRQLDGHAFGVTAVAWSPDGKSLLSGSYDNSARLWDVETGRELHRFGGHRNFVWTVNFSPDGRRILTAGGGARNGEDYVPGNDFGIRIWPLPEAAMGRGFKVRLDR